MPGKWDTPGSWDARKAKARDLYEAQNMSTADIAKAMDTPQTIILEWAAHGKWTRDRNALATRERAALVRMQEVELITKDMQARALAAHRQEIRDMRSVAQTLWAELGQEEDQLSSKVRTFERLVNSSKTLILLERQALGIETVIMDPTEPKEPISPSYGGVDPMEALRNKFSAVLAPSKEPTVKDMGDVEVVPKDDDKPANTG